jgi:hypothetical protein
MLQALPPVDVPSILPAQSRAVTPHRRFARDRAFPAPKIGLSGTRKCFVWAAKTGDLLPLLPVIAHYCRDLFF